MSKKSLSAAALAILLVPAAGAAEIYGGVATTGVEIGFSQSLGSAVGGRLEFNALDVSRNFNSGGVDYDTKLKSANAGVYLDYFVTGSFRLTGGALIGSRKIHGVARSSGSTIVLNGVTYPVSPTDTLTFDARFPGVTPYLGLGFGHRSEAPGFHFYADAGVAYGRPDLRLSPSASLAAKVNPADLSAEQLSAQDQADGLRAYPVLKLGVVYRF